MKRLNQGIRRHPKETAKMIFFVASFILAVIGLASVPRVSIPLMIAYVISLVLRPLVPRIMKTGLGRLPSIVVLFLGILFFFTYPIFKVIPSITSETQNLRYYVPKVENFVHKEFVKAQAYVKDKTGYEIKDKYFADMVSAARKSLSSFLLSIPQLLASLIEWIFLVPLFAFFLIKDASGLKRLVLQVVPNRIFERFYSLSYQFNQKLGDYIFAKAVEATIVGIIISTGLIVINIRFAILLGFIAAITNIIPYVGPFLGAIPALVVTLMEFGTGPTFWAVFLLYLIGNAVDIGIVFPILVSKIVDLHPLVVVISVVLGSQYFGLIGMVISIPLAAALKLVVIEIYTEIYGGHLS